MWHDQPIMKALAKLKSFLSTSVVTQILWLTVIKLTLFSQHEDKKKYTIHVQAKFCVQSICVNNSQIFNNYSMSAHWVWDGR